MPFRKTIFDTAALSFVGVVRMLAQFLAVPVLARLLSPADYGVVAMAMPFALFTMMLADAGIGMSLVRAPEAGRTAWATCFWLSALLGLVLAALMAALSPLAAAAFGEPGLQPIVAALALVVLAQALNAVPVAALQQEQRFKLLAAIEITSMLAGVAAAVAIALCGGGAWALAGQQLVFYGLRLLLTFFYSPFRPALAFRLAAAREHLVFGRDLLLIDLALFFSRSMDSLIIGRTLGVAAAGTYAMAYQFAAIPLMLVTGPLQFVLYSKLSRVKNDPEAIRHMFLLMARALAIVIFPGMGLMAAAHQPVFAVLLSDKWAASGWAFMALAPACALLSVTLLGTTVMLSLGRTGLRLRATIEFGVLWIAVLLVASRFGVDWAALAFSGAVAAYTPRYLRLVLPLIGCKPHDFWRAVAVPAALAAGGVAAYLAVESALQPWPLARISMAVALAVLGIAAGAWLQRRTLAAELALFNAASLRA